MKKKKGILKKVLIIFAILTINVLGIMNCVYATTQINSAHIYAVGDCGRLLKYEGVEVITDYVQYSLDGVDYPAYCMNKTKVRSPSRTL